MNGDNCNFEQGATESSGRSADLFGTSFGRWVAGILAGIIVAVAAALVIAALTGDKPDPEPSHDPKRGRAVVVWNRITVGANHTSEDEPLRLFTSPSLCQSRDCVLPGPGFYTGNRIAQVVCQTRGDWMTNGNENSHADDHNPQLVKSTLWYGAKLKSGRIGYFSAVWVKRGQRDGQGLPDCRSRAATE